MKDKEKITDIEMEGESNEFGMGSVGEIPKFTPIKVKQVEGINNMVEID